AARSSSRSIPLRHTIVGQHVRRANRNLVLVNVLLLAGVVALFAVTANYWVNFVAGPFEMGREEVAGLPNADRLSRYYVRIDGDQVHETGAREVNTKIDKRTKQVK